MKARVRAPSARGVSVKDDWRAWLPEEKDKVFRACVHQLEASYLMLSVSLNEAIEMRQTGLRAKSSQFVFVTSSLCSRLTDPLSALLRALSDHARHHGTMPSTAPLDPANFASHKGQRSARVSALLSRVLLSQRTQFLHKISTLHEMVVDLAREFQESAEDLADEASVHSLSDWTKVDNAHYDLNTCLRETIVQLKCFLWAVPEDEVALFQQNLERQMRACSNSLTPRQGLLPHGRMTSIAGQ